MGQGRDTQRQMGAKDQIANIKIRTKGLTVHQERGRDSFSSITDLEAFPELPLLELLRTSGLFADLLSIMAIFVAICLDSLI